MPDATHYTCRVTWSAEDGEHVATVAEFPSLSRTLLIWSNKPLTCTYAGETG